MSYEKERDEACKKHCEEWSLPYGDSGVQSDWNCSFVEGADWGREWGVSAIFEIRLTCPSSVLGNKSIIEYAAKNGEKGIPYITGMWLRIFGDCDHEYDLKKEKAKSAKLLEDLNKIARDGWCKPCRAMAIEAAEKYRGNDA